MFKRTIAALAILAAVLCLAVHVDAAKPTQWLIYWYVCGTNIETTNIAFQPGTSLASDDPNAIILADPDRNPGDVSRCIKEIDKATLSPDVRIFMQAGGTYVWGHEKFRDLNAKIQTGLGKGNLIGNGNGFYDQWHLKDPIEPGTIISYGKIGRYVYDKNHRNWHPREQLQISGVKNTITDMGSKEGLISFLQAGQKLERELYPEGNVRRVLILKDHGSGVSVCSDQYTGNIIPVNKINEAFSEVQGGWTNPEEKPFELVAFDACLMSTYETAFAIKDFVKYMVASQETTWNKVGLDYTGLLNELSKKPSMSGKELGKVICNTTWKDSKVVDKDFRMNTNAVFTLSVIDLSEQKMDALKTAYANFNEEANRIAKENSGDVLTFAKFKNAANVVERYPSSDSFSKQCEVDLKNFTVNLEATFPELKEVGRDLVRALDDSVVYNKRGDVLSRGGGLSTQFPMGFYSVLQNNMQGKSVNLSSLRDTIVDVDEEKKTATIELSEDDLDKIESIRYQLIYIMPRNDGSEEMDAALLGSDTDIEENRQTGTFTISFNSQKWVTLNENPLLVQVVSDATRKNKNGKKVGGNDICVSPILLNGEVYKLFFSRSYPSEKITLIGAVPVPQNDDKTPLATLPSGELKSLNKGDIVTPLYAYLKDEKAKYARGYAITIGDKPKMEMVTLQNGIFGYIFEFVNPIDAGKNAIAREGAIVKIKHGKIIKAIHSIDFESPGDLED